MKHNHLKYHDMMSRYLLIIFILSGNLLACHAGHSSQQADNENNTKINDTIFLPPLNVFALEEDIYVFEQTIETFENKAFDNTPLNELIISVAKHFLKTPYVASTLEVEGDEQLVVNLREMDCTTFVEYVLATSLTIKSQDMQFANFVQNLAIIRYRDGSINGYPSRLHYFSEWIYDNAQKNLVEIAGDFNGSAPFVASVNFMSRNPSYYRQMGNPVFVDSIKAIEKRMSAIQFNYIPKDKIFSNESKIMNGDIIAFTTSIAGLDVSHTGFALHHNGRVHLIHASTRSNQVEISPIPLSEYLKPMNKVTGILVARVKHIM
jgi:hypothetical protein